MLHSSLLRLETKFDSQLVASSNVSELLRLLKTRCSKLQRNFELQKNNPYAKDLASLLDWMPASQRCDSDIMEIINLHHEPAGWSHKPLVLWKRCWWMVANLTWEAGSQTNYERVDASKPIELKSDFQSLSIRLHDIWIELTNHTRN